MLDNRVLVSRVDSQHEMIKTAAAVEGPIGTINVSLPHPPIRLVPHYNMAVRATVGPDIYFDIEIFPHVRVRNRAAVGVLSHYRSQAVVVRIVQPVITVRKSHSEIA